MSKIDTDNSIRKSEKDLLKDFKFKDHEDYIEKLIERGLAVKIHFIDETTIKGALVKYDSFNYFLAHKGNILLIHKGNVKIIEPIA